MVATCEKMHTHGGHLTKTHTYTPFSFLVMGKHVIKPKPSRVCAQPAAAVWYRRLMSSNHWSVKSKPVQPALSDVFILMLLFIFSSIKNITRF